MKASANAGQVPFFKDRKRDEIVVDWEAIEDEIDIAAYDKAKNDTTKPFEEVLNELDKKHNIKR